MCLETWPNVKGTNREGTKIILDSLELVEHVAFGNTKIFIRDPQTLAELENTRAISLPDVVLIIQRVIIYDKCYRVLMGIFSGKVYSSLNDVYICSGGL